jgi:hypothetical protein
MIVFTALATLLLNAPAALAQYDLSWTTIDGGGGTSTAGAFTLNATFGQPDASLAMTGGTFSLTGGFWAGALPAIACPADIAPTGGNHAVDVNDLLAVITSWGACPTPCPPHCPADIMPLNTGNCAVDVNDLLAVITNWGPCP